MKNLSQKLYKEIKKLHSSKGRKKSQYYVIEGLRCAQEALKGLAQQQIIGILVTEKADSPSYTLDKKYIVTEKDFEVLSQTQNPQGILILAEKPKFQELSFNDDFILVLDRIQDPGNIGTILRTAIACRL